MDEIIPGVLHWATYHDGIGQTVHSHLHQPSGAVFDPRLPDGASPETLSAAVVPSVVLLSCRHHLRHAERVADAFGIAIKVSEPGAHEFCGEDAPTVESFALESEILTGVTAHALPALAPDEAVFRLASSDPDVPPALLFADSLVHHDGELAYMPDSLMGDDPEQVKRELTQGLRRILANETPFDALLFAHGEPIAAGGRVKLAAFLDAQ